jgi:hypothetical protein
MEVTMTNQEFHLTTEDLTYLGGNVIDVYESKCRVEGPLADILWVTMNDAKFCIPGYDYKFERIIVGNEYDIYRRVLKHDALYVWVNKS